MKLDRNTLLVLVVVFAAGWWTSSRPDTMPSPSDRPVLRWIARAAKNLLWVAVFVEPAPPEPTSRVVRSRVDAQGIRLLDNGSTL